MRISMKRFGQLVASSRITLAIWLLAGTFSFAYWWYNALIAIPLSETVWTIYFHLLGQDNLNNMSPAADLEFLTAIAIGFSLSYAIWRARGFLLQPRNALLVLWMMVGAYSILYWWVNSSIAFPLSAAVWNFYNDLLGSGFSYLASVFEIVTVVGVGFFLSYAVTRIFLFLKNKWRAA